MAAIALGLAAAGWAGSRDGGPVVLGVLARPVVAVGLLAALAAVLSVAVLRGTRARVVTALVAATLLTALPVVHFASEGAEVTARHPAPGRADRTLVVERATRVSAPPTRVYVEQGSGLAKRRWQVGRFADDLLGARWDGPDRIAVGTADGRTVRWHTVDLAPDGRTGAPSPGG
ncbi:hypothetical protein ACIRBX_09775 [Kitasatospora sp. NPDC096147]|uniref:hypothetical protein n=1 Tax=Kitasatospora sp. NPDC096147 TaxID=3364093 RepID=UPI00380D9A86